MSRLDSFIRRMQAQRDCLNLAAELIGEVAGPVLELGYGNGRTFDHLRERLPNRRIIVFDRIAYASALALCGEENFIMGDLQETLVMAARQMCIAAALAHCDIGSGDVLADGANARVLGAALPHLLAANAVVVSDQAILSPSLRPLPPPEGVTVDRYFMYRLAASVPAC